MSSVFTIPIILWHVVCALNVAMLNMFADKLVHQCRLAHVRVTHNVYESCLMHLYLYVFAVCHWR